MQDDDELCLCFHVSKRKVMQYIRVHRPAKASQLSECYGAGTGCGWCRPFLRRLMEQEFLSKSDEQGPEASLPKPQDYADARARYRRQQSEDPGTDNGATGID